MSKELPIWSRSLLPILGGLILIGNGAWYHLSGASSENTYKFFLFGGVILAVGILPLVYTIWKIRKDPEQGRFLKMTDSEFREEEKAILLRSDELLKRVRTQKKDGN